MKRKIICALVVLITIFVCIKCVVAKNTLFSINIETGEYSINSKDYESIKEYSSLEDFLIDYNSSSLPNVYFTSFLFDGVSSVKSPDLDDFIESGSNGTKIKTLDIKVLNINNLGDYELTGSATGMMVAVNTNDLKGNINLILNNLSINTDSKKAPAIYVYNKETTYTDCVVTIKTKEGTNNYIEGGKLKKVSLIPSDELDNYTSYYTNDSLDNYESYTAYYGIYSKEEINNILFATVKADFEDLKDGDPYLFYKGSGAISSDIDLYFEGEGFLKVTSKNKEGIETKGNLTFSGGTGDYEIYAYDDCLNTTTAKSAGSNVRNTMIIDVNSLLAVVNDEGDEGDAIDSNGSLTINGGTIYAYAHSKSQDSGLDSEDGIVINKGTIISTGNMSDMISNNSKQDYIYLTFNESINAGDLVVIKDQDDNIITAFKSSKTFTNLIYSSNDLNYSSLKVYSNGDIEGTETNGLYSKIDSYQNGDEITFNQGNIFNNRIVNNQNNNFILTMLISEISCLLLLGIYILIDKKMIKR